MWTNTRSDGETRGTESKALIATGDNHDARFILHLCGCLRLWVARDVEVPNKPISKKQEVNFWLFMSKRQFQGWVVDIDHSLFFYDKK